MIRDAPITAVSTSVSVIHLGLAICTVRNQYDIMRLASVLNATADIKDRQGIEERA